LDQRTGRPVFGGPRAFFVRVTQQFLAASETLLQGMLAVNSSGASFAAARRQVQKQAPEMLVSFAMENRASLPGCSAHVWEWFMELLPIMGAGWMAAHVDVRGMVDAIEMLQGVRPTAHELRLLMGVIAQLQKQSARQKSEQREAK
jgi:hypothetical protein